MRFPRFRSGVVRWTAMMFVIAPLYLLCLLLLVSMTLLRRAGKRQPEFLEHVLAGAKQDTARGHTASQELLSWLTGG